MDEAVTPVLQGDGSRPLDGRPAPRPARFRLRTAATAAMLAAAVVGAGSPSAGAPSGASPSKKQIKRLEQLAAAADREDCAAVAKIGAPLADGGELKRLSEEVQVGAYTMLVPCELTSPEKAYPHALAATQFETIPDLIWRLRLALEVDAGRVEASVATLEAMSDGRGAALNSVPVEWIWVLKRKAKDAKDEAVYGRLLKVLARDSYQPDQLQAPLFPIQVEYAELLAKKGDADGARKTIAGVEHPLGLMRILLNKDIRALAPSDVDLRKLAEAQAKRDRELVGLHPDRLVPLTMAADDLRLLGRPKESLDLLLSVRAKVEDPSSFSDSASHLIWYWDGVGRSYRALGGYEESVDAFKKGAALSEQGALNVSQVINLAAAQNAFGRSAEALKTLSAFEDPKRKGSPFGEAQVRIVRGCANSLAGNQAAYAADLDYIRAHEKDAPLGLADLLLCAGDIDGAAELLGRLLDDPDKRVDTLSYLSDYDAPPPGRPSAPEEKNLKQVKDRPALKAAIERAGGIRRIPLQRDES